MSRFTVLGASGFIGGALSTRLADAGHEVIRARRNELKSLQGNDLGHVFYSLGVDDAHNNLHGAFEAHIAHLVEVLRHFTYSSVTYLSSTRLYLGAHSSREDADLIIRFDDENAIYNATKIAGERICFTTKHPAVRVVRLSNVIGFAPRGISLIPTLFKNAIKARGISLTISPLSAKDYIALDDVLDLLPRIAVQGTQRCYNMASGINITLGEIVAQIVRAFPSPVEWRADGETVIFPTIDVDRIRSEFSFLPRPPLEALTVAGEQFRRYFAEATHANI
jgi:nucleoside-diphosphate-sugar epimerase